MGRQDLSFGGGDWCAQSVRRSGAGFRYQYWGGAIAY